MIFRILLIGLLFSVVSCKMMKKSKVDNEVAISRAVASDTEENSQEIKHQEQERKEVSDRYKLEFEVDDVFYWDADSGLQIKSGFLKAKIKMEGFDSRTVLRSRDTVIGMKKKSLVFKEGVHLKSKKEVDNGYKWGWNWWVGIGLLMLGLGWVLGFKLRVLGFRF